MVSNNHIRDLAETAIEKSIRLQLDVITIRFLDDRIKWINLEIQNKSDFLKGRLLVEILYDFTNNFYKAHGRSPNPTEISEVYRIVINRATDIKKAIRNALYLTYDRTFICTNVSPRLRDYKGYSAFEF